MSPIRVVIVVSIVFAYFALPGVSSLKATDFLENEYARVCDEDTWLDLTMTQLCEYVPKNLDIGKNLKTKGSCQKMMVELEDDEGNAAHEEKEIVLCVFGQDNKWCLSAGDSDESRQAKVYSYKLNTQSRKMTCTHHKDITIPEKGSGSGQGSGSRSGPKPR